MSDLPENWLSLPLGEVIQTQKGKKPYDLGEKSEIRTIAYINIKAFETKEILEYAPEQEVHACEPKDILLVWDGARSGLSGRGVNGYVGSTLARVRSDLVDADYLYYFFESLYSFLNTQTKGVGIPHINPVVLNAIDFFLPPEAEQNRIVEKLEELLTDLDDGIAELKTAQIKLGQYRQSLLKSAVDGTLTTEWRKQNSNKITESGEQLLTRILKQRRQHWEKKKLAEFATKDKTPPKNWQAKYPEPVVPDTTELPELPEGWVWATIDQLSLLITSGSRGWAKYYTESGAVFIRAQNIKTDSLILDGVAHVNITGSSEGVRTKVSEHDLLLTITGANVGKCAYIDVDIKDAYVSQHVALIRPVFKQISHYIHINLINPSGARKQLDEIAYGAGKPGLNLQQVANTYIPLSSVNELNYISDLLAKKHQELEQQGVSIQSGVRQLSAQRKNILKDAFTGKLVHQDPNDEPASILLAKIKAERAEQAKHPKPKRTKRKSRAMKKMDSNTLKRWVKELKQETFTFAELQKAFSGDYEELKEALFALLAEPNSVIEQIFDNKTGVLFQRTTE